MTSNSVPVRIASRMDDIKPFHVMKLLARARQLEATGRSIIHMEIGEADFPTPPAVVQAGIEALQSGKTFYTPATGLPQLKQAIADYYQTSFGVRLDSQRIIITPGSSGALQLLMGILINPGESVLLSDPGYPCNRHFVRLVEAEPIAVPVDYATDYQIDTQLAQQYWQPASRAVMLTSPANPTGGMVSQQQVEQMLEFLAARNGFLILDEIYQGLTYAEKGHTALQQDADNLFVINSFSKFFGMTGWRLGWMVVPHAYVDAADRLAQNVFLAPQTMAQYAAMECFSEDTLQLLRQRTAEFRKRRDFLIPALQQLGFKLQRVPEGAFYLYLDCSDLTDDSFEFSQQLLEQAGVAVTPGLDFGDNQPEKFVRIAFTTAIDKLEQGVQRISAFLQQRS
jgi:aspartate/methionine/tyrosine aminotransferase